MDDPTPRGSRKIQSVTERAPWYTKGVVWLSQGKLMAHPESPSGLADIPPRVSSERGASLVEYALLVALIAGITVTAVETIGANVAWSIYDANVALMGNPSDGQVGAPAPRQPRPGPRTDAS